MAKPKYSIKLNHLETQHGIHKLERDGFSKEVIAKTMYKLTDGAHQVERTKIMSNLYDRTER
jgi:hypothetical protein